MLIATKSDASYAMFLIVTLKPGDYSVFSALVWSGMVLWHINHCKLFNAKYFLYICITYMNYKHILKIIFLNEPKLIFLHTFKWFY